jgi:hypothetical protein
LKTDYLPFPEVKKRLMMANENIMQMPDGPEKKQMMNQMAATKELMTNAKERALKAMREGKLWGQPFLHVMFGNPDIKVTHH